MGKQSIPVNASVYSLFERSRVLCTRGVGEMLNGVEIDTAKNALDEIESWMMEILNKMKSGANGWV